MRDLPAGTVTFLFTDVEGSTRLLHELGPEAYSQALGEHRRLLRQAFGRHGGVEVDTQGDAFFVAFPTAPGAIEAAREACEALEPGAIRVRMGLHTGTPLATDEGYVGADVHRAARIAAAGYGGQVLVSASTAALVDAVRLRDLGEHRFRDLAAAERVFQLGDVEFPALRSLYGTNLPVVATPFLGREHELAEVVALVRRDDVRLVTLVGPGGTGKTRLGLQAAAAAAEVFPDGITWVPLASLRDPAHAVTALAQALEVLEEPDRPLLETLTERLAGSRRLLLLDNAEHLLPHLAGPIAQLRDAGRPTVLVTSRERLDLNGEHAWPVPPLEPEEGVELFVARARAVSPAFAPSPAVSELCERLDNLPLALELAAARTALFSPEQLRERLGQRLDLLKGTRDADPRHRTLRATIAWSHELLDPAERQLFSRLSIFAAGCSWEAAERVCEADPDTLQSLLDKSLLRRRETELGPRYWMLETIREFAEERLVEAGELEPMRRRLIEWAHEFAVEAEPGWHTPDGQKWVAPFRLELDNLRQAMRWAIDSGLHERALATAAYLDWLWLQQGPMSEGREWVEQALASGPRPQDVGLEGYALLLVVDIGARLGGDFDEELLRRSLPLLERGGRRHVHAYGCFILALHLIRPRNRASRDLAEAEELLVALEAAAQALADPAIELFSTELGAEIALRRGDFARARALYERNFTAAVAGGTPHGQTIALVHQARIDCAVGNLDRARSLLGEARAIAERDRLVLAGNAAYHESALVELITGDPDEAAAYLAKTEASADHLGAHGIWLASIGLLEAALQARRGNDAHAVESWSRADQGREGQDWDIDELVLVAQVLEPLRKRLPDDEFARLWQRGRAERSPART